jgi:predicted Zn-dependent protease
MELSIAPAGDIGDNLLKSLKDYLEFIGPGPNAVISIARLKGALLEERTIKEAVHELGHVFLLRHCPTPECVMHFSNSLQDTDYKSKEFCPECRKLWPFK